MPRLPSGTHCCIDAQPFYEMLDRIRFGVGLDDLARIRTREDLRPWLRFLWLLPLGADAAANTVFDRRSNEVPGGLSLVDSGRRVDGVGQILTGEDLQAFEAFWNSPRCQDYLDDCLREIRLLQQLLGLPEENRLSEQQPRQPLLQA